MGLQELEPDERLAYWVGKVTMAATVLHGELRGLFYTLVGPNSSAAILIPPEMKRTADVCLAMLSHLDDKAPLWLQVEGKEALQAALKANDERNRYVHDEIYPAGEPETWVRHRLGTMSKPAPTVTAFGLQQLQACVDDVHRAGWRMTGLAWCVEHMKSKSFVEAELKGARAVMKGDFDFSPGGGYRGISITRSEPLPVSNQTYLGRE